MVLQAVKRWETPSRWVVFCLGSFEFYTAWTFYTEAELRTGVGQMLPAVFAENYCARVLFTVYLLTLGLQRLTWYFSTEDRHSFEQWLCLLLTHLFEACMWWILANEQGLLGADIFTLPMDQWPTFLYNLVTLNSPAQGEHLFILFGVPYLVLRILTKITYQRPGYLENVPVANKQDAKLK